MPDILIIDDDDFTRGLIARKVRSAGYTVREAADAAIGIKAVLDAHPDLILLDVHMPYMSGLDVLKAIKGDTQSRDIPVVMLTADSDDNTWLEALRWGAADYLTKPFEEKELIEVLGKWAGK
jgi:CheY-like chemotaxis protein